MISLCSQWFPHALTLRGGAEISGPGFAALVLLPPTILALTALCKKALRGTAVLLAWFFAQNHRHNAGILRMLGGSKGRALCSILLCALLIAAISGGIGSVLGHKLSEQVGQEILAGSMEESAVNAPFQAYIMTTEAEEDPGLTVKADRALSVAAGCGALLFPALTLCFVLGYIHKEPRALLPNSKV